jgi:predicted RNA-binding protein associated with RNAse of E/G family
VFGVSDPRKDLEAATRRYRKTATDHDKARDATVAAVLAALRAGVAPVEVERLSPFTGTYIRKMAREHGIPPAPPGPKRS